MNHELENYLVRKSRISRTPIKCSLELTPLCNLNCSMCYVREDPLTCKGAVKPAEFFIGLIKQMDEIGTLFVGLIGGEPLLYPQIDAVSKTLVEQGCYFNITTNGTPLAKGIPEWMMDYRPMYVTISLYGGSDETYGKVTGDYRGYSKVKKAVENLKEAGIPFKFNYCAIPDNVCDLDMILDYIADNGYIFLGTSYCYPPDVRGKEEAKDFCRLSAREAADVWWRIREKLEPEKYRDYLFAYAHYEENSHTEKNTDHIPCNAGSCSYWVDWRGRMLPCGLMDGMGIDLETESLSKAWEKISKEAADLVTTRACAVCGMRQICSVCPAMMLAETGAFAEAPSYLCEMTGEKIKIAKERFEGKPFV